ncbi:anti-sigma factor domain-containing protein [Paenibacillus sp. PR3]|uniref:Anti-sigma factor domain-containing protein n=1 Tax=Paenibacillus terricola TaxID=2763503 RepID=A0ABR8N104_9BACL|nr:anti-sigma factor domain-containing protein [Paenibacillus terricola]MBD3920149.1 anti-sigma factor domain-containing protein [Paenibacillus terricola]
MVSRRAIVMEMSEKHLIVLTPSGEFRRVPRSGQVDADIGDEIILANRRRQIPRRAWAWTAAALVVLLLFPLVMVPTSKAEPIVAYVTLDVNPSVELGINDEEEVRELRGLNDEGKNLASGIDYKGKHAADVVASLVEKTSSVIDAQAAAADHDIVIASVVVGNKLIDPDQFEVQLESDIHEAVTKVVPSSDNVTVISVPKEVRDEAERSGVSTGKMAVYLMAKSKNPKLKLDSLKDQSIQEWTASEGGVQSVVPSKQKEVAAASTTPATKAANPSADKETELKSKAASNKEEKEALKALLEREKRAKAKREEKRQSGRDQGNKSTATNPSGTEPSGQKPGEANPNNRPNTAKPSENKGNSNGNNVINRKWNNGNHWNPNNPIINNGINNSNQQGNSNQNGNQQGNNSGSKNGNSKDDSKNSSKGSSGSKNNTSQSYDPKSNNSKNNIGKNNSGNNDSKDSNKAGTSGKNSNSSGSKNNGNDYNQDDKNQGSGKSNGNDRNSGQNSGKHNSKD